MKIKSLISLILVLAIAAGLFAGCGGGSPSSGNDGKSAAETDAADAETPEDVPEGNAGKTVYSAGYLPEVNYGGYEFRMVSATGYENPILFAAVEEETGDTVADAVYKRNRIIEERYGIKFKQIGVAAWDNLTPLFQKSTKADTDDFDLCMMISRDAWAMALTGAVVPVNKLPHLNITQPWYAHDVNSHITINNKLYFAYSDECLHMFASALCIMFNKKLVEDFALENMYGLVNESKWTIDKFFELSKVAAADMDGDGIMTETDRYGILSQADMFYPCFWVSSGIKTVSKDSDDLLIFTGDGEKLYNVLDKIYQNVFGGDKIYFDSFTDHAWADESRAFTRKQFENNLGLFLVAPVDNIPALRAMETDFGIIPFPKYDEAQEKYYSRVVDGWIYCVPSYAPNLERTSVVMEALAVESKNITVPAYMDTALRTKYARDDDSQDMLDIIHANRTMDLGDTFYMDPVRNIYVDVFRAKKDNFASAVEKKTSSVDKQLQKANDAALTLE